MLASNLLPRRAAALVVLALGAIAIVAVMSRWGIRAVSIEPGREALLRGDYDEAERVVAAALRRDPDRVEALHLGGRCALAQGEVQKALDYFDRIPDSNHPGAVEARCISGELLLDRMHDLAGAETQYRRALNCNSDVPVANDQLAYILGLAGRSWEAAPYRLNAIRNRRADRVQLFLIALGNLALENPGRLREILAVHPEDPLAGLGMALQELDEQNHVAARERLTSVVESRPELIEAWVRLGRLILDFGTESELADWHTQLPAGIDEHPGIWTIRGLAARRQGQNRAAVRCLWESVRREPNSQDANYQLGQSLIALNLPDEAAPFLRRSEKLQEYLYRAHMVHIATPGSDAVELRNAAMSAQSLGLQWEAAGWAMQVLADRPGAIWARKCVSEVLQVGREPPMTRCHPDFNPALQVDYSRYQTFDWRIETDARPAPPTVDTEAPLIQFTEQARPLGIDFQYFNGGDPGQEHFVPLYEQTGGGAAAVDFDSDGWCDLYLTQGAPWPPDGAHHQKLDRLYHNRASAMFIDATAAARIEEPGFSQGVSFGDVNCDGFSDILVGNIGANRLLLNQGDGTFRDASADIASAGTAWTTSCSIFDLNGDALPDIYAVNYLAGADLFDRACHNTDGSRRPCPIQSYEPAQDRLLVNLGDGSFEDVTRASGIAVSGGRGLGIAIVRLDESATPAVYVANDVSPNFLFINQSLPGPSSPDYHDRALVAGAAVNEYGEYEAGMGIAVGDADGDALLDLFVTNFQRESNTLYRYLGGGFFDVATRTAGLKEASFHWLGFGTQFLDADLDGDLDLVVANGHVDDVRAQGGTYRMPPQFFRNQGDGRFEELRPEEAGNYFSGRYLGRGLARLDWDRDGKDEFAVSHLDAPVALLHNESASMNRFIVLHLRGTRSERDAIGATATTTLTNRVIMRQLTAGDGYQACNQRRLTFGIPANEEVLRVDIEWPSGLRQSYDDIVADRETLLIEGRPQPFAVRGE